MPAVFHQRDSETLGRRVIIVFSIKLIEGRFLELKRFSCFDCSLERFC